jgi:hypothetical protein
LKLKNLLDADVQYTQGEEVTREFQRGRELSADLQWTF